MTVGELAGMINDQGWLFNNIRVELHVIPMDNWERGMWFDETGLTFIKPSPNMPDLKTAAVYPGLCLLEGTNVSEGRGTMEPFLVFGAPWINSDTLSMKLNNLNIAGMRFEPETFVPEPIPGMASNPKYSGKECHGARVILEDRSLIDAYWSGILITDAIKRLYPDSFEWRESHFDRLCGMPEIRKAIAQQSGLNSVQSIIRAEEVQFREARRSYLIYF
jgi:uncharacterized protein YbbC (DUF1343 family)